MLHVFRVFCAFLTLQRIRNGNKKKVIGTLNLRQQQHKRVRRHTQIHGRIMKRLVILMLYARVIRLNVMRYAYNVVYIYYIGYTVRCASYTRISETANNHKTVYSMCCVYARRYLCVPPPILGK